MRTPPLCAMLLCLSLFGCRPEPVVTPEVGVGTGAIAVDRDADTVPLWDEMDTGGDFSDLSAGTRVTCLGGVDDTTKHRWVKVRVSEGKYADRVGYVYRWHLALIPSPRTE